MVHVPDVRTAQHTVRAMLAHIVDVREHTYNHAIQHTKTDMKNCTSCSRRDLAAEQ